LEEHLRRYQRDDRTGPHEFGFEYNGKYRFLDFVRYDNEAMYLKISTDEDKANLYFDLNDHHFEPGSPNAIELKATKNIDDSTNSDDSQLENRLSIPDRKLAAFSEKRSRISNINDL
jgi:hypothetical protein